MFYDSGNKPSFKIFTKAVFGSNFFNRNIKVSESFSNGYIATILGVFVACFIVSGCASPFDDTDEARLHDAIIATYRQQAKAIKDSKPITLTRHEDSFEKSLTKDKKSKLDKISGKDSFKNLTLNFGDNLTGDTNDQVARLTLYDSIHLAIKNNLKVQGGRLLPEIAESQVVQAEAKFDAMFFTKVSDNLLDTPRPNGSLLGITGDQRNRQFQLSTGIQQPLDTGGKITLQADFNRQYLDPTSFSVDHYYTSDIMLGITQPLLRGFGSDVNRAKIVLAKNNKGEQKQKYRATLITTIAKVVQTYWQVALSERRLKVQQNLVKLTKQDRKRLLERKNFDATTVQVSQATSYLEANRKKVVQARQQLRLASDNLKQLIHSPDYPVSSDILLLTDTEPIYTPVKFNLLDSVTIAMRNRPELKVALLQIKDAVVRQKVAENGLLPILNISASIRYNAMDTDSAYTAFGDTFKGNYIDYLLSGQFKMPIGNRKAKAQYQQRRLEHRQALITYRSQAQTVVADIKKALHNLSGTYKVASIARAARRAAADNLRALHEQEKSGTALTPEFLVNLKLNAEQRMAEAQISEALAILRYNNAMVSLLLAKGTLLKHYRIDFNKDNPNFVYMQ